MVPALSGPKENYGKTDQEQVVDELCASAVKWNFNTPDAHSTKCAIGVMLGNVFTVDKTFLTVITKLKAECLLNSASLGYGTSA